MADQGGEAWGAPGEGWRQRAHRQLRKYCALVGDFEPGHVDTKARLQLAELIAGLMRRDVDSLTFGNACFELWNQTRDPDVAEVIRAVQCHQGSRGVPAWRASLPTLLYEDFTRDEWELFSRLIAFLSTNLRLTKVVCPVPLLHKMIAMAALGTLWWGFYGAYELAQWWIAIATWLAVGLAWLPLRATLLVPEAAYGDLINWMPFRTESEWRQYEPALEAYRLPEFAEATTTPEARYLHEDQPYLSQGAWGLRRSGAAASLGGFLILPLALLLFQRGRAFWLVSK